jgi:beta-mannosidase
LHLVDGIAQVRYNEAIVANLSNAFRHHDVHLPSDSSTVALLQIVFLPIFQYAGDLASSHRDQLVEATQYPEYITCQNRVFIRKAQSEWGWNWGPCGPSPRLGLVELLQQEWQLLNVFPQVRASMQPDCIAPNTSSTLPTVFYVSFELEIHATAATTLNVTVLADWTSSVYHTTMAVNASQRIYQLALEVQASNVELWWTHSQLNGTSPLLYSATVGLSDHLGNQNISKHLGFRTIQLCQPSDGQGGAYFYLSLNGYTCIRYHIFCFANMCCFRHMLLLTRVVVYICCRPMQGACVCQGLKLHPSRRLP